MKLSSAAPHVEVHPAFTARPQDQNDLIGGGYIILFILDIIHYTIDR